MLIKLVREGSQQNFISFSFICVWFKFHYITLSQNYIQNFWKFGLKINFQYFETEFLFYHLNHFFIIIKHGVWDRILLLPNIIIFPQNNRKMATDTVFIAIHWIKWRRSHIFLLLWLYILHQKSKETHANVWHEHGSGVSSLEPRSDNEKSIYTMLLLIGTYINREW